MEETKDSIQDPAYCCYLIMDSISQRTYIGISNNFDKRLRQHNCEIKGGAKYTTRQKGDWRPAMIVEGFKDKSDALKFEWSAKRAENRKTVISGIKRRSTRIRDLVEAREDLTLRIDACPDYRNFA